MRSSHMTRVTFSNSVDAFKALEGDGYVSL